MQERAWVKDFFTRWSRKARPLGDDQAFYQLLRRFHPETLGISTLDIQSVQPVSKEDAKLVELWYAWNDRIVNNSTAGHQKLGAIAKELKKRPEPYVLLGASSLLGGDRDLAHKAFWRAARLNPNDTQIQLLLQRLGVRRPPVLSFLDRRHPLNITLGRVRARFISE